MTSTVEWPAAADEPAGSVFVFGCGSVGAALALAFARRGVPLAGACCRTPSSAARASAVTGLDVLHGELPSSLSAAATVIAAVPDPAIRSVASTLAGSGLLSEDAVVLHCSGARSAAELEPLARVVAGLGSFHPLLSFADSASAADHLTGATFGIEGDLRAVDVARGLARALGAEPMVIEAADRPLYHAAAAVASNHLVALVAHAARCLAPIGVGRDRAVSALLPLVASTVANLQSKGVPDALTGPVSRGDRPTISAHIETLEHRASEEADLYVSLARQALTVAREQAVASPAELDAVEGALGPRGSESS